MKRLDDHQRSTIIAQRRAGVAVSTLAEVFKVSRQAVYDVVGQQTARRNRPSKAERQAARKLIPYAGAESGRNRTV